MTHRKNILEGKPSSEQAWLESTQYSRHDKHVLQKDGQIIFSSNDESEFMKMRKQYLDGGFVIERIIFIADIEKEPSSLEKAKKALTD